MKRAFMTGLIIGAVAAYSVVEKDLTVKSIVKKGKKAIMNKLSDM